MAGYSFLFHPFILSHEIAICNWNAYGCDIESAVPQLPQILAGTREWRAIIINTDAADNYEDAPRASDENPFDYTEIDNSQEPHESPIPIIRLTHMLGGYASKPKCQFEEVYEYYDEKTKTTKKLTKNELDDLFDKNDDDVPKLTSYDIKNVYAEIPPSEECLLKHKKLVEKYQLNEARPAKILLIAMRGKTENIEQKQISDVWSTPDEMTSSSFWERNHYPVSCRFLCTDIVRDDASGFLHDTTSFWFAALTVAINNIPSAYLQAYRLYQLNIEVSGEKIQHVLNRHLDQLAATKIRFEEELAKEIPPSFYKTEEILPPQSITVASEQDDSENVCTELDNVRNDELQEKAEQEKKMANAIIIDPKRAIERAAKTLRENVARFPGRTLELDEIQYENLKERIASLEKKVLTTRPKNKYDKDKFQKIAQKTEKKIDNDLSRIMSKRSQIAAFTAAIVLVLVSFAPYIWNAAHTDKISLLQISVLALVMIGITCLGGYIAIQISRKKEKEKIQNNAKPFDSCYRAISSTQHAYTEYFTNICTLMKGYAMLDGTKLCDDSMTTERRLLYQHVNAIEAAEKRDISWLHIYNMDRVIMQMSSKYIQLPSQPPGQSPLYYFTPDERNKEIPLNTSGECVFPPYSFIRKLIIEREEVFDDFTGER